MVQILESLLHSVAYRSIIWMFCRTVPELSHENQAESIRQATFLKEFRAAQIRFPTYYGIFDYSAFYLPRSAYDVVPWDYRFIRHTLGSFVNQLNRMKNRVIFPQVQRKKNTSRSTTNLFNCYESKPYVRTVDLEEFYHRHGIQIGGECEMREAWKFNDLKPRFYYCQGGRDYFASRFVKKIAVALMESIPATQQLRRSNPERYLALEPDDYVTTWDFEAFTSNLGILKFFLSAIANGLRNEALYPLRCFDSFRGVVELYAFDILDDYNNTVNISSPFSLERIIWKHSFSEGMEDHLYHQVNNGMLGVAGNIGFSTANHGFEVCRICHEDKCVCVGDDALAISSDHPNQIIIPTMSRLGSIHPEKFEILEPEQDGPLKFTKRAFWRDIGHLFCEILYNLPIAPYVDQQYGERTVPVDIDDYFRAKRVATSTGSLLSQIHLYRYEVPDEDMKILATFLDCTYSMMQLPRRGFLPGAYFNTSDGVKMSFFCLPAIELSKYDPRQVDWLEYLFESTNQEFFAIPYVSDYFRVPKPSCGDEICMPRSAALRILEDFGYVSTTACTEIVRELSESNRRRVKQMLNRKLLGMKKLLRVHVKKDIPTMFDDLDLFVSCDPHGEQMVVDDL